MISAGDVENAASWEPDVPDVEVPFQPSRVVLQDLTGVPAVVDLAALRSAADRAGKEPSIVEPEVPCDLVIDHSVQVDYFGSGTPTNRTSNSSTSETKSDIVRSSGPSRPSRDFNVVPPGTGIVHQVNLEHLGKVVHAREEDGEQWLLPDTLSRYRQPHPMIGGIGVVGWGVGGIEARSSPSGAAHHHDAARSRRRQTHRRVAGGRDRDRPRAPHHRSFARSASSTSSSSSTAPASPSFRSPTARRSPTWPRARIDDQHVPGRRRDARLPRVDRPRRRPHRTDQGYLEAQRSLRRARSGVHRGSRVRPPAPSSPASPVTRSPRPHSDGRPRRALPDAARGGRCH